MEFMRQWGDKIIMVFLFILCISVGIYAFHTKEPDLASTVVDLAKQILAGLLTLLVAARTVSTVKNGNGGHGGTTTTASGTTSSSTTITDH